MEAVLMVYIYTIVGNVSYFLSYIAIFCLGFFVLLLIFLFVFVKNDYSKWQNEDGVFRLFAKLAGIFGLVFVLVGFVEAMVPNQEDLKFIGGAYLANKVVNSDKFDKSAEQVHGWLKNEVAELKAKKEAEAAKSKVNEGK